MPDPSPGQVADAATPVSLSNETQMLYELQKPFVEPLLRMFRLTNTAIDVLFYDVGVLTTELWERGTAIKTGVAADRASAHPLTTLDLSAATNPSGSIIVVNANAAPYIRPPFLDMGDFFTHANGPQGTGLHTIAVTGVGSSAYGSVAFAWDVSAALGEPVAAVVPGYGLADVVPQALGGWFGFEFYGALQSATQNLLAATAPSLALMGKDLARSTPGRKMAPNGAPVFLHGSAASDDVHAILQAVPGITRVVGHSKGALAIENALRDLPAARVAEISVLTFGCVISEDLGHRHYSQYLGWIDGLGLLNSEGHSPEYRPFTTHSTNTHIPLSMTVADGVRAMAAGRPASAAGS
jgi:hypothetical protein